MSGAPVSSTLPAGPHKMHNPLCFLSEAFLSENIFYIQQYADPLETIVSKNIHG